MVNMRNLTTDEQRHVASSVFITYNLNYWNLRAHLPFFRFELKNNLRMFPFYKVSGEDCRDFESIICFWLILRSLYISYILLHKILPPDLASWRKHQESRHCLTSCLWLKVSHQIVGLLGLHILKAQLVGGSASKLTHMVIGKIQFLTHCRSQFFASCWLPSVPCHVSLSIGWLTTWQLAFLRENKRERAPTMEPQCSLT